METRNIKMLCSVSVFAVSLGVIVGMVASSTTSHYATVPSTVARPVAISSVNAVPVQSLRSSSDEYATAGTTADYQTPENVVFQTQPSSVNWAVAALGAATAAVGAFVYGVSRKATSAYETIRDDPEAVLASSGRVLGAVAASAVLAASANAASLTYDEQQSLSYLELKGTGLSNTCPIIVNSSGNKLSLKAGKYVMNNFCLEPSTFQVKVPSPDGKTATRFERTALMTRLTYTLDGIIADLDVGGDGSWTVKEVEGIDYAPTTVQLESKERVPFLFSVKNLQAKGDAGQFLGQFDVPSYRGATFLDPKGRGGATGYDTAVALPATGDSEELEKENLKNTAASAGTIAFKVAKVNSETGEVAGVFESIQPSDTDMGAKVPKDVKISGVWYAQISPA